MMILIVDNGSVYTHKLEEFFVSKNIEFTLILSDKLVFDQVSKFDSIILSGRRKNDQKMNSMNSQIIKHCIAHDKPLLGICYGAEILALTVGGTIRRIQSLQKGNETVSVLQNNPLCQNTIDVFESHHYEISKLSESLISIASSKNCKHEIIKMKNSNIFGTQFHPEMTSDGHKLVENFTKL